MQLVRRDPMDSPDLLYDRIVLGVVLGWGEDMEVRMSILRQLADNLSIALKPYYDFMDNMDRVLEETMYFEYFWAFIALLAIIWVMYRLIKDSIELNKEKLNSEYIRIICNIILNDKESSNETKLKTLNKLFKEDK